MLRSLCCALIISVSACYVSARQISGLVIDKATGQPIRNAIVTSGTTTTRTNAEGVFVLQSDEKNVAARAYGYGRTSAAINDQHRAEISFKLSSIIPRAVYLSFWGVSSAAVREPVLKLAGTTPVNAVVIDVKGDLGYISYRTSAPIASEIGSVKTVTIPDIRGLIDRLHAQGMYAIARIVTFKDNVLAVADPALPVRMNGKLWRDREGLAWCDPFQKKVWDYNISLAVDAAKSGFDEIEFDYVRFPDAKGLQFSQESTEESRSNTITAFLTEARRQLTPYNVFLSADVFGYICWNTNDTGIGQKIERVGTVLDYISPMLYPSGFAFGIPNYRDPVEHPYEIVRLSLDKARARTGLDPIRFRPWLQGFADYAFDKRQFGAAEIQAQIRAAQSFGSDGWLLWNPRNSYSGANLQPKKYEPVTAAASTKQPGASVTLR
ncbi:MAG: putative glycoside hydrolase [Acidobacteriaceae bacterium]|nr:putative glycoside hydrolase [Acidobacteriaceae bacterium]